MPIQWDSQEVAYYVGFQVDLVDQPNAILDRMKDGTYVVNYSLLNSPTKTVSMRTAEQEQVQAPEVEEIWTGNGEDLNKSSTLANELAVVEAPEVADETEMLEMVESEGIAGLDSDQARKSFNKLLLDNADDFIHVLSLKGSLLYCSPSAARILEYDPSYVPPFYVAPLTLLSELVGKTLPSLCHPSDVIPVMRELKDSGNVAHPVVSLLYRIRRKHSGYIWIEASGKLHGEYRSATRSTMLTRCSRAWEGPQVCHPRRTTARSVQDVVGGAAQGGRAR